MGCTNLTGPTELSPGAADEECRPLLVYVEALDARGWAGTEGLVRHTEHSRLYSDTHANKPYLRVLLAWDKFHAFCSPMRSYEIQDLIFNVFWGAEDILLYI